MSKHGNRFNKKTFSRNQYQHQTIKPFPSFNKVKPTLRRQVDEINKQSIVETERRIKLFLTYYTKLDNEFESHKNNKQNKIRDVNSLSNKEQMNEITKATRNTHTN